MLCQEIIEVLEEHSPAACALEWDNVGLLAGRRDREVRRVMIALDAVDDVIEQAVRSEADMLLTHHPLIYGARKSINTDDCVGRKLVKLIQADISYYAMHTNFDVMGMAQLSAEKLGLVPDYVLEETMTDGLGQSQGIGRYGKLPERMELGRFAEYVKECFGLEHVRVCGALDTLIENVAVSGGSGKSMVEPALRAGADVLVSGDFDHHTVLDAVAEGLCIIDAGHFGTEKMFVPYMSSYLKRTCPGLDILEAVQEEPFHYM